jgi:rubrerythrin
MYDRDYYEANRERINRQHRENYAKHRDARNAKRRVQYHERRCDILLKQKHDRAPCPLCHLTFRRIYLPIHTSRRHPAE